MLETPMAPAPENGPTLKEHANKLDRKTADIVEKYLESGYLIAPMLFTCKDILGSGEYITGCCSLLSDGLWSWRRDLIFYVRRHRVDPGDEFVTYVMSQKGKPEIDVKALEQAHHNILKAYEEHEKALRLL